MIFRKLVQNKRIVIVANSTWNIYNFRLNIIEKLLNEGSELFVLAPLDEYISYKERFPKVKHIPLINLDRDHTSPLKDFRLISELKSIYQKIKPDLVISYTHKPNIFGGIAAKLSGTKSIGVVTGLGYAFLNNGWIKKLTTQLYKFSNRFHKKIIFENEDDLDYFISNNICRKENGVAVNGCGVDTEIYVPHPNGHKKEKTVFTFIGRLLYDKGIVEYIEAAKSIKRQRKDAEFWIVGELDDGNPSMIDESQLLQWIEEGHVIYHGFVKDVKPLIAKSDCIVLPSYREGMPRIILEGMSMAKPVITTNTAGCRQTVPENKNGYLVEVKDVGSLSDAMNDFLDLSYNQRHQMGAEGREIAIDKFNSKYVAEELYEIISSV